MIVFARSVLTVLCFLGFGIGGFFIGVALFPIAAVFGGKAAKVRLLRISWIFFEFVMKTNSRLFLQGADRIVRGYGQRLAVQEFSQEVENLMKGHIQFIQNQNPMEFGNLLNSLPIEERQEISNLLQNCCVCWISQFLLISVLLVP